MTEIYVIMQIDLISGEKEPIGVCDDLEHAVGLIEASNSSSKTNKYVDDVWGKSRSGVISEYNRNYFYIKHVPLVVPE